VSTGPVSSRALDNASLDRVVTAARECFAREGAGKTWMAAVAAEAGMVRQTLYSFVSGRRELIELALIERSKELMELTQARAAKHRREMPEAIVEFMALMVELTRDDVEFGDLAGALSRNDAFPFLTGPSPLRAVVLDGLRPYFEAALEKGLLRTDRTLEDLAGWVQTVLGPLAARADLDSDELRDLLREYVLPGLLMQNGRGRTPRSRGAR
jgi:AcrR family transcriptional regulator